MIYRIAERLRKKFGEERMIELICSKSFEDLKSLAYG